MTIKFQVSTHLQRCLKRRFHTTKTQRGPHADLAAQRSYPQAQIPKRAHSGYWKQLENQKAFFELAAQQLNIKQPDDWYQVSKADMLKVGGNSLLGYYYRNSFIEALSSVYPDVNWKIWKFAQVPKGFWKTISNQRLFMESLRQELKLNSLNAFYNVKAETIREYGGGRLLMIYNSLQTMFQAIYPEHPWVPWKFHKTSKEFWLNKENQRTFFESVANDLLGIEKTTLENYKLWYSVKGSDIAKRGGRTLITRVYGGSLSLAIVSIYPEFPWQPWKFLKVANGFWKQHSNVLRFLEWVSEQFGITKLSDWFFVSKEQFSQAGGSYLLHQYGGLIPFLKDFYPDYKWDVPRGKAAVSKAQTLMLKYLIDVFPGEEILLDHKQDLFFPNSQRRMELDVFIPQLKLGFEYQGEQHYQWHYLYGSPEKQKRRDEEKRKICADEGVTLVEIPFWWDRSKESLVATIRKYRPELTQSVDIGRTKPITDIPPRTATVKMSRPNQKVRLKKIEAWNQTDSTGWWLTAVPESSQRFFWNGHKILDENGGNLIFPEAAEIASSLPKHHLEGYWMTDNSGKTRIMLVDSPSYYHLAFEDRMNELASDIAKAELSPQVSVLQPTQCRNEEHFKEFHESAVEDKNILLLSRSGSYYLQPSSTFQLGNVSSTEVVLVEGRNGSEITCKRSNGVTFTVSLPADTTGVSSGYVISVKSRGYDQSGKPLSPEYLQVLSDGAWKSEILSKFPYHLVLGRKTGGYPKCRVCKKILSERDNIRFEINGTYTPPGGCPYPAKYSICFTEDLACIKKHQATSISSLKDIGIQVPSFEGTVAADHEILENNPELGERAKTTLEREEIKLVEC